MRSQRLPGLGLTVSETVDVWQLPPREHAPSSVPDQVHALPPPPILTLLGGLITKSSWQTILPLPHLQPAWQAWAAAPGSRPARHQRWLEALRRQKCWQQRTKMSILEHISGAATQNTHDIPHAKVPLLGTCRRESSPPVGGPSQGSSHIHVCKSGRPEHGFHAAQTIG